jgi:hypothetical protein
MKQIFDLLDQIIELAKMEDRELTAARNPSCPPQGESAIVFHLKQLRCLLLKEDKRLENIIQPNNHKMTPFDSFGENDKIDFVSGKPINASK